MPPRPSSADTAQPTATPSQHAVGNLWRSILPEEKPVASGNGILVYITLAEPVLFLQGFDHQDATSVTTAMLRGSLVVRVAKTAKIKAITLSFHGKSRTEWPEGIPPRQSEFFDEQVINRHTWPFFNAQFPAAEQSHGADYVRLAQGLGISTSSSEVPTTARPAALSSKEMKRLSLQLSRPRSTSKGESGNNGGSVSQKGYRTFYPGDYVYTFELPLDSRLPETIDLELGKVKYELDAVVERAGAFRANMSGTKEVKLIRAPAESSLEQVEPIAISRTWEDQLHYDIVISGKLFPLGAQVPIAFKLTPLAKVQCHLIRVFLTETVEYFCCNKTVHRVEPIRKILLFEKKADSPPVSTFPGSSIRVVAGGGVERGLRESDAHGAEPVGHGCNNLLGNLNNEADVGPTEMEVSVQLPSCHSWDGSERSKRIHFDTTASNIQVHHWIKIVMRLSKPSNQPNSTKRRHFEISIDSPLHILSCQATQANIALPAYSSPTDDVLSPGSILSSQCYCSGSPRSPWPRRTVAHGRSASEDRSALSTAPLVRPPVAHLSRSEEAPRPIHLLRSPSFNPPAFDAEVPPPLLSPPPRYDSVVGHGEGLADYFARLADELGDEEAGEAEDRFRTAEGGARSGGRLNVPLTPGGRVHRSMDERRTWLLPGYGS